VEEVPGNLRVAAEETPALLVLRFAGKMRDEAVRGITAEVDRLAAVTVPILMDLSGVTHMDSMGVALLVRVARSHQEKNLPVAVIPGPGPVARLLGVARLDRVLNVVFSRTEALQLFGVANGA
jgi:anti-anti-sigma factor